MSKFASVLLGAFFSLMAAKFMYSLSEPAPWDWLLVRASVIFFLMAVSSAFVHHRDKEILEEDVYWLEQKIQYYSVREILAVSQLKTILDNPVNRLFPEYPIIARVELNLRLQDEFKPLGERPSIRRARWREEK